MTFSEQRAQLSTTHFLFTLIALLFIFSTANSQSYNYRFHNLSIEEGLSSSGVNNIIQDSTGFLWIATDEGLNRYDGYSFKVYQHNPLDSLSLPSDDIADLALDSNGNIWLATSYDGLLLFNVKDESFNPITGSPGTENFTLKGAKLSCIYIDSHNIVWVGTREYGLVKYDPEKEFFVPYSHNDSISSSISANRVFNIIEADDDHLWVSTTQGGLNKFNKKSGEFERFGYNNSTNGLPVDGLRSIYKDSQGILWIGSTKGGLTKFEPQKGKFTNYLHDPSNPNSLPSNEAYSIAEDDEGRIWVGTWAQGLSIYNPLTDSFQNFLHNPSDHTSIHGNIVKSIFKDKLGKMWMGLGSAGLSFYDPLEQNFGRYTHKPNNQNSLSGNKVRSVLEDSKGLLWIGTIGNGLNKYDPVKDRFEVYRKENSNPSSLNSNTVWSIYEDEQNTIWIGTTSGLHKYFPESNSFKTYLFDTKVSASYKKNNILEVTGDGNGNLYLGTWGGGLNKFNTQTETWTEILFDNELENSASADVKHVLFGGDNTLWVSVLELGLGQLSLETNEWTFYKNKENKFFTDVLAILESSSGSIWVGTEDGVTVFEDKSPDKRQNYSLAQGLSGRLVTGLEEDENGMIWAATTRGLNSIDPKTNKIKSYFKEDGLQSNEFNEWASAKKGSKLYFGGSNGLNEFSPENFREEVAVPKVLLTKFLIFNEEIKPVGDESSNYSVGYKNKLSIDYSDYIFAFEFVALNAAHPQRTQYAYMLEGFDKEWIFATAKDRKAVYTNVPHGTYTFKVKATNSDGVWNTSTTDIKVIIIPPWWKTWWAKLLFYLSSFLFLTTLYLIRTNFLRKQKLVLENQVVEKTEEIASQNAQLEVQKKELETLNSTKDRLLSLISHDVRTPLNSLKGLLFLFENSELTKTELTNISKDVGNQVHQITTFLENLSRWAKNQLHGTKLDTNKIDLGTKISECTNLLSAASKEKKIDVHIDIPSTIALMADEEKLKFVIRNLLSNAIKFCGSGDKIEIKAVSEKSVIKIVVKDTGTGIEPSQLANIFDTHHISLKGTSDEIGTGLGLSLCKEYVTQFGGEIGVESTLREGSAFWFTVPNAMGSKG